MRRQNRITIEGVFVGMLLACLVFWYGIYTQNLPIDSSYNNPSQAGTWKTAKNRNKASVAILEPSISDKPLRIGKSDPAIGIIKKKGKTGDIRVSAVFKMPKQRIQFIDTLDNTVSAPSYSDTTVRLLVNSEYPFSLDTTYYGIRGRVSLKNNQGNLYFDSLWVLSKPTFSIGYKRQNFFKRLVKAPELVVVYQDSNPHIQTMDFKGAVFVAPKKWYQKPIFYFLCGSVVGGIALSVR